MPRYTKRQKQAIKDKVLKCLSAGDLSMTAICEEDNMPPRQTIHRWRTADPEFGDACKNAERGGWDLLATDILNKFEDLDFNKLSKKCASIILRAIKKDMEEELTVDQMERLTEIINEHALDPRFANAQVQVVTNQFRAVMSFLSKRDPANYGERIDINQTIDDKRDQTPEEMEARLKLLTAQRKKVVEMKH